MYKTNSTKLVWILMCLGLVFALSFMLAFVEIGLARAEQSLCTLNGTPCASVPSSTSCTLGTAGTCYQTYSTQAAAFAAHTAQDAVGGCGPVTGYTPVQGWRSATNQAYPNNWTIIRCSYNAQLTHFYFMFPDDTYCGNVASCPDADGDGLKDDIDPYPNDSSVFWWRVSQYQLDQNGQYTWIKICTDRGDCFEYGDLDSSEIYINSGSFKSSTTLSSDLGFADATQGNPTIEAKPDPTMAQGEDDGTYSDELSALDDVVKNTKATADNVAGLKDSLGGIHDAITGLRQQMADSGQGTGGGGVISGGSTDPAKVEEGIGAALDARTTSEGDFSGITQNLEGFGSMTQGDIESGAGGEKGSLTTTLNENTPTGGFGGLGGFFTSSAVNASGACSFSFSYKGRSIPFGVCEWGDQLQMMGAILLALAGVYSLMIVLGKA